jgi:hypothetical protein
MEPDLASTERGPRQVSTTETEPLVFAFTDETGNSGLNLFDHGQPFFWTGTLLTETDLDTVHPGIHQACLKRAGVPELHGNVLGLTGIERIAGQLRKLIHRYRMKFVFTRVEKRHLACTKFVDTLMDSGLNKAVSNLHYGVRFFRLYNAHIICALLHHEDQEEFWAAYAAADAKGFCRVLRRLEGRICTYVEDPRTRQILLDAIGWALKHPEPLLEGTRSSMDAPNVVALGLLANVLHRVHQDTGMRVRAFIHDEQNQFGKALRMAYQYSSAFASSTSPFSLITDISGLETFQCSMTITKSSDSFGLQFVDVMLWLVKRFLDNPNGIHGQCQELAEFVMLDSGIISHFSRDTLLDEVIRQYLAVMSLPITPGQEAKARGLVSKFEAARLARMNEGVIREEPVGGLRPLRGRGPLELEFLRGACPSRIRTPLSC